MTPAEKQEVIWMFVETKDLSERKRLQKEQAFLMEQYLCACQTKTKSMMRQI